MDSLDLVLSFPLQLTVFVISSFSQLTVRVFLHHTTRHKFASATVIRDIVTVDECGFVYVLRKTRLEDKEQ